MKPTDLTTHPQYPMRVVVRRTGLNASVLRAWERRYDAVVPERSDGGQRLYSEADVQRLSLLRELVDAGHTISQVAELDVDTLRALVRRERRIEEGGAAGGNGRSGTNGSSERLVEDLADGSPGTAPSLRSVSAEQTLARAEEAVREMSARDLEIVLNRGAMALTPLRVVDEVVVPLLATIGREWEEGHLSPATEHAASQVIRRFLGWLLETMGTQAGEPLLVVSTPSGQRHEFGALLAAVSAAGEGWDVLNLGPDLPAQDIAEAAIKRGARAVALSAIFPLDDERLLPEVLDLRAELPATIDIVVGGPAMARHAARLRPAGVEFMEGLSELRAKLRRMVAGG
jgi:MerR family transcriptional regulator, light-induced transcriptional regulator